MHARFMLTAFLLTILAVPALWSGAVRGAADEGDDQKPSVWMKKKLEFTEKILAGLASEDYDNIGKNARLMNTMSHLEKWVRGNTPEYRTQLKIFQNANDHLIRMADEKNLDGAALAYVQMTLSCVNCHKVVRASLREEPSRSK